MPRDKATDRDRRDRDRGRERDVQDDEDLRDRIRAVETLATDTAHLASTSAFRFGSYAAGRGLVFFVNGDLKERITRRWSE